MVHQVRKGLSLPFHLTTAVMCHCKPGTNQRENTFHNPAITTTFPAAEADQALTSVVLLLCCCRVKTKKLLVTHRYKTTGNHITMISKVLSQ
jgi:hypothetical protein